MIVWILFNLIHIAWTCQEDFCEDNMRTKRSFHPFRSERYLSTQITSILDELFNSGYDRQIRPQIAGPPLEVEVNVAIRSMGPVDETTQTFAFDCYFRQFWTDPRLKFNSTTSLDQLAMNWAFLNKIWRPDTFIVNGKNSYLHKMTVPNRFIRISPSGRISYSQRLTLKARCQMDLRKFPLDSQTCPLKIGSFGHDAGDIIYKWSPKPLSMDELELAQYDLVKWESTSNIGRNEEGKDRSNTSIVALEFTFKRQTGFFILQIYVPLTLIVCCSWVTFWLVKTEKGSEIPARTSLGATTVLSVVTIGFGGKSKPQVGYATALDVFIILCFFIVFAALVEFAILNFIDTFVRRIKKKDRDRKTVSSFITKAQGTFFVAAHMSTSKSTRRMSRADRLESVHDNDAILEDENLLTPVESPSHEPTYQSSQWETIETMIINGADRVIINRQPTPSEPETIELTDTVEINISWSDRCLDWLEALVFKLYCSKKPVRSMQFFTNTNKVCFRVDSVSRKLFPLSFLLLNLAYWTTYVYIL